MKKIFLLCAFIISIFSLSASTGDNSRPRGKSLSDLIYDVCKNKKASVETQSLVAASSNEYAYNIILPFESQSKTDESNFRDILIIGLRQEEIYQCIPLFEELIEKICEENFDYDLRILLTFGDDQKISKSNSIRGIESFVSNIDSSLSYSCILLSFGNEKNSFLLGSDGLSTPVWLCKIIYKAFSQVGILNFFHSNYISHIYKTNLFHDTDLGLFLQNEIPCAKVNFSAKNTSETTENAILSILKNYNPEDTAFMDTHAVMFPLLKKHFWLSEGTLINLLLIFIFISLFTLIAIGFINGNFQLAAWHRIKKIWYLPFFLFLCTIGLFYFSTLVFYVLETMLSISLNFYFKILFTLPFMFALNSYYFITFLRISPKFKKRSIDFLIFISVAADFYFFSMVDISLFPLFFFEFFIAVFALAARKKYTHELLLVLYELPFLPYLIQMADNASVSLLTAYVNSSKIFPLVLALLLTPQYLICFRIYTTFNFQWFKTNTKLPLRDNKNLFMICTFTAIFIILIITLLPSRIKKYSPTSNRNSPMVISKNTDDNVKVTKTQKKLFSDTITTLQIECDINNNSNSSSDSDYFSDFFIEQCDLKIRGKDGQAVLFSDDTYQTVNSMETVFVIPYEPPPKMTFTYGENQIENDVIISLIFNKNGNRSIKQITIHSDAPSHKEAK